MATGWLDLDRMVGAETQRRAGCTLGASTTPPRSTGGSPTARSAGCAWSTTARPAPTASEARLDVECEPHPRRGPAELRWESNTLATEVRADHWSFPGLEVSVTTDAPLLDPATRTYGPSTRVVLDLA